MRNEEKKEKKKRKIKIDEFSCEIEKWIKLIAISSEKKTWNTVELSEESDFGRVQKQ